MVAAIVLAKIRIDRGGLGWWTIVWVSFIGLLLFIWPNRPMLWAGFHTACGARPRRDSPKGAQESNSPPQRLMKPEHCAPKHTTRYLT